jgi:hypothetical protein
VLRDAPLEQASYGTQSPAAEDDRVVATPFGLFLDDDRRIAGRFEEDRLDALLRE